MSHLVFARKYRPQTFKEIVGQEHVTKALTNAIVRNRVPHALLFAGPRGVGKTSASRVLSKALNCTGRKLPTLSSSKEKASINDLIEGIEPCGSCANCMEIAKGSNLAVNEIDGASHNRVEDARDLIQTLLTGPPPNIKYKIYIIDEVHMLSVPAFNALLKTLEEPPPNVVFILATTEAHKIPDTVISRCQTHEFKRLSLNDLRRQLKHIVESEKLDVEDEVLSLVAKQCFGGMRDASSILERIVSFCEDKVTLAEASQILGVFDFSFYAELIELILTNNKAGLLEKVDQAFLNNLDIKGFFSDFASAFRILMLYSVAKVKSSSGVRTLLDSEELPEVAIEHLECLVNLANESQFFEMYDMSREIADTALRSQFPKYVLEAGLIRLSSLKNLISLTELVEKLSQEISLSSIDGKTVGTQKKKQSDLESFVQPFVPQDEKSKAENLIVNESTYSTHIINKAEPDIQEEPDQPRPEFHWNEFLRFLQDRSELVLFSYLGRAVPSISINGSDSAILKMQVTSFDGETLSDPEKLSRLKEFLRVYSGITNWEVDIEIAKEPVSLSESSREQSGRPKIIRARHLPGSYEGKNAELKALKTKKIHEQARTDELVKAAMSVFSGSVIEKITPLQKNSK